MAAACTGPASPPPSATPPTTRTDEPPEVVRPLDVAGVAGAPCERLLTAGELRNFEISSPGRPRTYFGVHECSWVSAGDERLRIGVVTTRDLLSDTYRSTHTPVFEPTSIEGYPSVRQRTSLRYNACDVTTGLGGRQALETDWTGAAPASPAVDPCVPAEKAIALVIRKLPPQK